LAYINNTFVYIEMSRVSDVNPEDNRLPSMLLLHTRGHFGVHWQPLGGVIGSAGLAT
jgi:hypothetical protein